MGLCCKEFAIQIPTRESRDIWDVIKRFDFTLLWTGFYVALQIHMCRMKVTTRSCHFYNNVEGTSACLLKSYLSLAAYLLVLGGSVLPFFWPLAWSFGVHFQGRLFTMVVLFCSWKCYNPCWAIPPIYALVVLCFQVDFLLLGSVTESAMLCDTVVFVHKNLMMIIIIRCQVACNVVLKCYL